MTPPKSRTVRAHVRAHRPQHSSSTLIPVSEKRVILDDQGGVLEIDILEPFACDCPREQPEGFRCCSCGRLFCARCPNTGHTRTSTPLCGACSRLVVRLDGSVERVPRRGYWKRRVKRYAKACVKGFLSLFIEQEDRP